MEVMARVRSVISPRASTEDEEKPARVGMVMDTSDANYIGGFIPVLLEKQRHPYSRPEFLFFSDDDIVISADKSVRPVICPKFPDKMPLLAGYAEVINAGKTTDNEDQATARLLTITQQGYEAEEAKELSRADRVETPGRSSQSDEEPLASPDGLSDGSIARSDAAFFAVFDGHAGTGAAIMASKCLHEHVKSRLSDVIESIIHLDRQESYIGTRRSDSGYNLNPFEGHKTIQADSLVIGALQSAFVDMDAQIAEEKQVYKIGGGCAVIAALVILGKVYVANAGDCRAVLVTSDEVRQMSTDFTPATERKRLQELAYRSPELIGNCFSRFEYARYLNKKDLKRKVLYRDWFMDGWSVKTVRDADLRPPLIADRLKKKRLLNTIGVTRGFGDHHLLTADDKIPIKPFLSAVPEVRVVNIRRLSSLTDKDVLVLASDGLWDVISNEDAGLIVRSALSSYDSSDASRYSMAAQELVMAARGNPSSHRWMMNCGGLASADDITVIVIPLTYAIVPPQNEDDDEEMIKLDL